MLEGVARLARALPVEARLVLAPTIDRAAVEAAIRQAGIEVAIVPGDERRFAALASSHLALCASGTATLETGLVGTPMIVLYRLGLGTYWMGRLLVRLPHVSLVNLVLGREAVPELLQNEAEPGCVAATARRLLESPAAIRGMRDGLGELRSLLGAPGATGRAADAVLAMLERAA
jgi:lipid-A-disaccharide synthase